MSRLSKSKLLFSLKDRIHGVIHDVEMYRIGRILTIVDASISDPQQRKALKDLIHDAFSAKQYHDRNLPEILYQFCQKLGVEPFDSSNSYREFMQLNSPSTPPDTLKEDYFPEKSHQEDPSVASDTGSGEQRG